MKSRLCHVEKSSLEIWRYRLLPRERNSMMTTTAVVKKASVETAVAIALTSFQFMNPSVCS